MSKQTSQTYLKLTKILFILLTCSFFLIFSHSAQAETVVTNNISVSANSNSGTNHATVKTVINGNVIEDWSATSTEPIKYTSNFDSTTEDTENAAILANTPDTLEHSRMKALIAQLEALISFYVSLLHN